MSPDYSVSSQMDYSLKTGLIINWTNSTHSSDIINKMNKAAFHLKPHIPTNGPCKCQVNPISFDKRGVFQPHIRTMVALLDAGLFLLICKFLSQHNNNK